MCFLALAVMPNKDKGYRENLKCKKQEFQIERQLLESKIDSFSVYIKKNSNFVKNKKA